MKTKAYLILFILCALLQKSKAQSYFNNRYDGTGSFDGTNSVDTFQNKYLTIGVEAVFGVNIGLSNYLFNIDGTVHKKKTYGFAGDNLLPNIGKYIRMENQFYACGLWAYFGYKTKAFLWRFNSNLDSVKFMTYGFLNQENVVTTFIKQSDTKIYMTGYVDDTLQTNRDILLIKTDTAGNEIWKKKIGVIGWDETAISIDTLNGNLLIGGYKTPHASNYFYGLAMRLDTAGNVIWQRNMNTNGMTGSMVKKLKDGNILLCGLRKTNYISGNNYVRLYLEKIDANNNLIWSKLVGQEMLEGSGPTSMIENKNGNILITSQIVYPLSKVNGLINEINQNGDSLFTKEYSKEPGSQNYFRDVMQTSDGGYCFAGFVIPVFANGGTGTQDIWLLKVDSNFCESAVPCGYGVGIDEKTYVENGIKVYPNPAKDILHIELVDFNNEPYTIEISNELGQVILSQTVSSNLSTFNVQHLPNGMYFLTLKMKDKKVVKKIIIQY